MGDKHPEEIKTEKNKVTAKALSDLIRKLIEETPTATPFQGELTLDCRLERDLGLGSLARTELLTRINKTFAVLMPDEALFAESPRELLVLLAQASGMPVPTETAQRMEMPGGRSTHPSGATTLMQALDWHLERNPERTHILPTALEKIPRR